MIDVRTHVVSGYDGELTFDGRLLGEATSQRRYHADHGDCETHACAGSRCSACRWFEVRIFRTVDDEYVVEMTGQTTVPGEQVRHRVEVTRSPVWVIDVLTQREDDRRFIPLVSRRVLIEAAATDVALEDAYNRQIVA